jgi:hypothetical protein
MMNPGSDGIGLELHGVSVGGGGSSRAREGRKHIVIGDGNADVDVGFPPAKLSEGNALFGPFG